MAEAKPASSGSLFFHKPSLKFLSRRYRANGARLKACNCEAGHGSMEEREMVKRGGVDDDEGGGGMRRRSGLAYRLIFGKQMVGIFLSVWVRRELVPHVGHLRSATVGRGIMGCLRNKGCIAISMSLGQTTFCFVCSHLASGEKEGDELRRNLDVAQILKNTRFPRICKTLAKPIPRKIIQHDRVIWLGDLNYRLALSYTATRKLLEEHNWNALLMRDQLAREMEAGRVFKGWQEGKIQFAPTYKYTHNSDSYAGETTRSKKSRRTPAWCDRILWHGEGIEQQAYIRGESRFSDHRPVCAVFMAKF
ncbi:DNAse I-like superfamily protein [Wolffia australiana]